VAKRTDQDETLTWHTGRPRPRPHCVRWGSSSPVERGSPTFEIYGLRLCLHPYNPRSISIVATGQTAGWTKMKLGMEVGLGLRQIVLNGAQLPSPKGHRPLIFGHVCCGQTAGWIKMQLGTEVGLGLCPSHTVLGPSCPYTKGHSPLNFLPMSIVAKRLDGKSNLACRQASAQATL